MDTLTSNRVANLRKISDGYDGGRKKLAADLGMSYNQVNMLCSRHGHFGVKVARAIEERLGLSELYLDQDYGNMTELDFEIFERVKKLKDANKKIILNIVKAYQDQEKLKLDKAEKTKVESKAAVKG